jgi:multiple sugar transport system ATP-binding protein
MGRIALRGVTKRFGDVVAVDDVTFAAEDEEFLVLLGPSGCGKSTVLRIVAGLDDPDAGVIEIGGRIVNEVEPEARDVAMVFQSYALYPHMSVRRNIAFPLNARKVPAAEREAAVDEAARVLGLEPLLDRRPAQLSGGQRQRVALARAIVRKPAAFLMDEPLSNLDAKLRVQTRAELIELQKRLATTVLYVTHDQVEAMTMGDRIAVMENGRLQQIGRPTDVYAKPANIFVARFLGNPPMNTVAGRFVDGAQPGFEVPGATLPLPAGLAAAARAAGATTLVVGVRPEHLQFTSDTVGVPAEVTVVEELGHEQNVVCRLGDGSLVIARVGAGEPTPAPHETVRFVTDAPHLHLFDGDSGLRLEQV